MTVSKTVTILALAALLFGSAGVASAQYLSNGCTTPPNVYYENGNCVPYYPYPGHDQVINGQPVATSPAVLGASTTVPNLPGTAPAFGTPINATGQSRVTIMISDTAFSPSAITVSPGTTIVWTNDGTVTHMVQSTDQTNNVYGASFTSGPILAGGTFTRVFTSPGTYTYSDSVTGNAAMNGEIIVAPATNTAANMSPNTNVNYSGAANTNNGVSGTVLGASTTNPNLPNGGMAGNTDTNAATTYNAINAGTRVVSVGAYDNFFDPHNIVIPVGATVTWTNKGTMTHSVQADNGAFASPDLAPNATYSHIFNTPGTYVYHCRQHGGAGGQGMFGTIVVLSANGTNVSTNRSNNSRVLGAHTNRAFVPTTNAYGQRMSSTTRSGSVLGASTTNPNVPNTGAGGDAATTVAILLTSLLAAAGGALLLRKKFTVV